MKAINVNMQRIQKLDEGGFMSSEIIADKLTSGYERRKLKSGHRGAEVYVPSDSFFKNLINEWVYEKKAYGMHDSRSLSRLHKVGGLLNCNDLADEWCRCFLTNPFDSSPLYAPPQQGFTSPFLFKKHAASSVVKIYMIGVSGFRTPDLRRIVMTERVPILIPIYNISVAAEEHLWDPELGDVSEDHGDTSKALTSIIIDDLCGLYHIEAEFDKKPISGCTVVRCIPYEVHNIPANNVRGVPSGRLGANSSMNVCHGGLYVLLNPDSEAMNKGEHLLYFKALSVNYEIEAKVHIGVLAA